MNKEGAWMELQQLEYFKVVAELQHMTHAAEQLNISQPALSKSIANIEQEIGVPLFDRQGRSIYLNRYGQLFLDSVNNILQEYERAKQEINGLVRPGFGEVSLGFIHTLGLEVVPDLMAHIHEVYPNMKFNLTQAASYSLLKSLEEGQIDFCLSQRFHSNTIEVEWIELWSEELFVIVPKSHKFAGRESIELVEIEHENFIAIKKRNMLRKTMDYFFEQAGIRPNIMFEGEEIHTVAGFVSAGLGVSLIPNVRGLNDHNVCKIRVSNPTCVRKIGLSWASGRYLSPAAVQFKNYLIEYFKNNK